MSSFFARTLCRCRRFSTQHEPPPLLSCLEALLRESAREPRSMSLHEKTLLLERAVHDTSMLYPSAAESERIARLLHLHQHPHLSLSKLLALGRRKKKLHAVPRPSSQPHSLQEKKLRIRSWLSDNSFASPSQAQLKELQNELNLSKASIINIVAYYTDRKGTITQQKKDFLFHFLKSRNFTKPTTLELASLREQLHLGTYQLHKQISMLLNAPQTITPEKRSFVKNWLVAHNYATPSTTQLKLLQNETQLTAQQLYSLISRFRDSAGTVTQEKKDTIHNFLKEHHPLSHPPPTQIDLWKRELNLSRKQIHSIVRHFLDPPGEFTDAKRELIRQKWEAFIHQPPTHGSKHQAENVQSFSHIPNSGRVQKNRLQPLVKELQKLTGLSALQIQQAIRKLKRKTEGEQAGKLTAEKKEYIEQWLLDHPREKVDLEHLRKQTGLSKNQVQRVVSNARDMRGVLTEEKIAKLKEWVHANGQEKPTREQLEGLQRELLLSRSQIKENISKMMDPNTELTREKKAFAHSQFEGLEAEKLPEQTMSTIKEHTQLSRRQVQYLWRQFKPKAAC